MHSAFIPYDQPSRWSHFFIGQCPPGLLIDIARVVREATRAAFQLDMGLLPGARRDKFAIDRRAYVMTGFHGLGEKYAAHGVRAQEKLNAGNNYHHVQMTAGQSLIIAAQVESDSAVPREAEYRKSLAERQQLALPFIDQGSQPLGDSLLAVVLYGPSSEYPMNFELATPGFVVVRFPAHDWSGYVEGRVDLLARLAAHETPKAQEPELHGEEKAQ